MSTDPGDGLPKVENPILPPSSQNQSFDSIRPSSPYNNDRPPRRAMASFDNLVALANHQERLREARKMVWRDKGEPVVELPTIQACIEHSLAGGARAATLAFSIRAGFNLVLALFRLRSIPKNLRFALIRRAVLGEDTWRFAAMLGTFVTVYKTLINTLPLIVPAIQPPSSRPLSKSKEAATFDDEDDRATTIELTDATNVEFSRARRSSTLKVPLDDKRTARLSLSAAAQLVLVRKKTRRWHAALAGAIAGGLAVMWEKRGRRIVLAQQLFVRGLQGSYNAFTTKHNIVVPFGAVWVFSIACGQILYAWTLRPDSLPRSYSNWISNAGKVPRDGVQLNKCLVRDNALDNVAFEKVMALPDITYDNQTALLQFKNDYLTGTSQSNYIPHYGPCAAIHPAETDCLSVPVTRFRAVFKWMLPIYSALHFIPPILFKRKVFAQDPLKVLIRSATGTVRSSTFLALFVVIYQAINCLNHQSHEYLTSRAPFRLPQKFLDALLVSKGSFWVTGFMAGLALFVEESRRRGELAMYVLPKALESVWIISRGKVGVLRGWRGGEGLLTAIGMAMVMSTYQNDPQHLSGLVRRILYQFIGPN